jgi:hypothetical protein
VTRRKPIDEYKKKPEPNKYARKPKPEQRIPDIITYYYAYGPDGKFQGEVKLTAKRKAEYEAKGFTFKPRKGVA